MWVTEWQILVFPIAHKETAEMLDRKSPKPHRPGEYRGAYDLRRLGRRFTIVTSCCASIRAVVPRRWCR